MPLLDVSEILYDVDLADVFKVKRRAESISTHGRSVIAETIFESVVGVVTASSPSDLDRKEDYQSYSRSITVVCKFHLRGETTGNQPDVVVWKGSDYLVKHVDAYPHFGNGFFQAECSSMNKTDPTFEDAVTGQLVFNQPLNAVYLGL